ncbi:hypothetical protein [Flavobacterium chungangense]|uniref:Uncharacterized protein n=1 Tax=Flavobacterium chungangense TaxID=554283 RepID=A0A6V6YYX7_9FLAO|nr:hypothetical protein [Flavobacterium chungangense]CAD0004454.1 hypothetical protein FLACHUCJ7_01869 [Flavobacterium chungangense]
MDKKIQDAFRKLMQRDVDTFPAKVISVDKEQGTCMVSDDQIKYTDVQLSSVIDGNKNKFFLFPTVGSSVLVSPIKEDIKRLYVESYSEIESLDLQINTVQFRITEAGFLLKKENETLKGLVSDLLTAVENMSFLVTTTGGAGNTTTLVNAAQFTAVKNRFNEFLNDV